MGKSSEEFIRQQEYEQDKFRDDEFQSQEGIEEFIKSQEKYYEIYKQSKTINNNKKIDI